jgi:guanine nucleotide-binding protein G(I)/G(S)/G(T) subunit beta-1
LQARQDGSSAFNDVTSIKSVDMQKGLMPRRVLKGHFGKVYACHWAGKATQLVSASQDGKLIVWNARTTNKILAIPLRSSWVMTCAYEQTTDDLVACGGLDNLCSIYKIRLDGTPVNRAEKELAAHDGYLSCCRFLGQKQLLTSSGDSTCILWDVDRGEALYHYNDHAGDVMSIAVNPTDQNVFVSGSCDSSAKVWDVRNRRCIMTFRGHESDINSVSFFPSGTAIGTGSDDSSCRLWDLRAVCEINQYGNDRILCGITSVEFSRSGRLLFAGYDDYSCHGWDVVGQRTQISMRMSSHENRVSCLGINPEGNALCTGSWDTLLKVWA